MNKDRLIIAGGNGFIGRALVKYFHVDYECIILARRNDAIENAKVVVWDGEHLGEWTSHLEGATALINLAGRSVDCRYNAKNKAEILASRINSTNVLQEAIKACKHPPTIWLNAASATIYRHSEDKPMTEELGEYGSGFSVEVCQTWEKAFFAEDIPGVRKVAMRIAITLGKGGVMRPLTRLVRLGFGGKMGSGRQMFSWIHEEDLARAMQFLIETTTARGVYNVAAPNPVKNHELMSLLRKKHGMPSGIPLPAWLLEIGAILIRTETELVLKSRFVVPEKLLNEGFEFRHPTLDNALKTL